ncbi:MAG: Holliday junction branch migration protein RuvA [Floccifex porci]|uniref:Holliday junction branch migration protein RuvA n=1 Tax=Floccifex porci TaxID=2606629 RepID=UPI0023F55580|nr:Holliday junction branch migration protein RuvA [Floccifex porci]MCI7803315.1 Holliday junction branch migration protein RuvA [Erysipelotrichaceae bacterium]MDD7467427.1 Holliday junction branch migration protein RuvA [Floccifex porci]MDY4797204.1 Holliday junction branch migration protein RuvA [Floccifex porci]
MIAFVSGKVKLIRKETIVIDVQGIGYEVYTGNTFQFSLNQEVFLYTYQHVREDAILLFGFIEEQDYDVFMRLINVKGIGPKTALNLLVACPAKEMVEAIENDDIKRLKALPGIGAKTASQIVLDLKGKFVSMPSKEDAISNPVWQECQEALIALGYKPVALNAIKKELSARKDLKADEMLRLALSMIAKRNGV